MEDLKDFYADRMRGWDKKEGPKPPRLSLEQLLQKAEENKAVDRIEDSVNKDKIDLLKRVAVMLGLKVEDIFKC